MKKEVLSIRVSEYCTECGKKYILFKICSCGNNSTIKYNKESICFLATFVFAYLFKMLISL